MIMTVGHRDSEHDALDKLFFLKNRFSDGLKLSMENVLTIGWLYFLESGREGVSLTEHDVKGAIVEASKHLHLEIEPHQINTLIQRLLQTGVMKAVVVGRHQGCRLARLGRNIAKSLLEEVDYSSEQLNSLLSSALSIVKAAGLEGEDELRAKLKYVFFDTILERIESKVSSIEEDLEQRKQRVREAYSGQSDAERDQAQKDLETSREALTELVDAVKSSSACEALEVELIECAQASRDRELRELLGRAYDFLYNFRERIDLMLADLVEFIRDCAAYRSLAFSVSARDRLCRNQDKILAYALDHPLCMPVLPVPGLSAWGLPSNRGKDVRPVIIDLNKLNALSGPPAVDSFSAEFEWKAALLDGARKGWETRSLTGEVSLPSWLRELSADIPEIMQHPELTLLFLAEDWPAWSPGVSVQVRDRNWTAFGEGWMMESVVLVPLRDPAAEEQKS